MDAIEWVLDGFNPRAHAGRDDICLRIIRLEQSFNPRAHAGRDLCKAIIHSRNPMFQSTRPRGARHRSTNTKLVKIAVSIHAPTRGATKDFGKAMTALKFQSTRPRGARLRASRSASIIASFQSTRPRGARLNLSNLPTSKKAFQSTRPRGARLWGIRTIKRIFMFQSTRPRGARLKTCELQNGF